MKIGVVSDSHRDFEYLNRAIKIFQQEQVQLIIHLGDDYQDIGDTARGIKVVKVPGIYDPEYTLDSVPNRRVIELAGFKILLTHSIQSNDKKTPATLSLMELAKKENAGVIFYGHTHIPSAEEKDGCIWLNPGHIKSDDKRGFPPSYALVSIEPGRIEMKIININNQQEITNYQKHI